ncbi:LV1 protein, partial [Calyptomena viridis]|nr:LV1 protein [Calyptomena viridis]
AASLSQQSSASANLGDTIRITCSGGSGSYGCYQQKVSGSALVTVICSNEKRASDILPRFSGSLSGSTGTLTITVVPTKNKAVYYCCGHNISSCGHHGGGTDLG